MSYSENGMPYIKPTRSRSYEKPLPMLNEAQRVQRKNVSQNSGTYEEEILKLQMRLNQEHEEKLAIEEEFARVQSELNRAVFALGSIHTTDRFRVDDEQITKLVKDLRYDIKAWSQNFPPGKAQKKNLGAMIGLQQDDPFRDVVSNPKIYLNSDSGHDLRALIQGYVWHILIRDVFHNGLWVAGPCFQRSNDKLCKLFDFFDGLERRLHDGTRGNEDYYHWRAQTSRLVAPIAHKQCIEEATRVFVRDVKQELKSLALADNKDIFFDRRDGQARATTFESVVQSAVTLDKIIWQQKACFSFAKCYGRDTPGHFDPDSMEADTENCVVEEAMAQAGPCQPARQIQLTKAPAFLKAGTSEGKEYNMCFVLLKAEVDLSQPMEPSLSRQTSARV